MKLQDKVVWIVGASSGIGEALAAELARRGARLILSGRRVERLEEVRAKIGEQARALPLDVEAEATFAEAAVRAEGFFGRIDVLVNNAGVSQRSLFAEADPVVIRRLAEINFLGPVLLTRAVLPGMIARGAGHILFVGSFTGVVAVPHRAIYCAAKHAIHGLADSVRAELWHHGIGVSLVAPGFIRTEITRGALTADGGTYGVVDPGQAAGMSTERCARRMVRVIERERHFAYIGLGRRERLALVARRLAPGLLARVLRKANTT